MTIDVATKPWEPSSILNVKTKDPNFTYRWISKNNVDKRLAEGWEIVKGVSPDSAKGKNLTLADGTQIDSCTIVRNLILARMPNKRAESRNKYYEKLSQDSVKAAEQKFRTDVGSQGYGSIKVQKGE